MTGRVPSAFSRARLMERSSTVLFQVGSSWPARLRPTPALDRRVGHLGAVVTSRASGSLCPHQMAIDGWWPSRSTALRAWRTACLRTQRA